MNVRIFGNKLTMGAEAARQGAAMIRVALAERGKANIILATAASQFEVFQHLVKEPDIAWQRITVFHLDEYVGLPMDHAASFRRYLWERFSSQLPLPIGALHYLNGEKDCEAECRRVGAIIEQHPIDVAFIGIGENGHLAFNDPPADFATTVPYHVVELDEVCRLQQYNEGWFESLDDVPRQAISMTVSQILKSKSIVCTVPDQRKAAAVQRALEGEVTPDCPASVLQNHSDTTVYLDEPSAALLDHPDNESTSGDGLVRQWELTRQS